jgi:hypothetical protein
MIQQPSTHAKTQEKMIMPSVGAKLHVVTLRVLQSSTLLKQHRTRYDPDGR